MLELLDGTQTMHVLKKKNKMVEIQSTKTIFSVSLDNELFKKIEEKRGLIPRSAYIGFMMGKILNSEEEK